MLWSQKSDINYPDHVFGMLVIRTHFSQHKPQTNTALKDLHLLNCVLQWQKLLRFWTYKANTNMYRNTMYIPTITSWLHSQWQSYIATKSHLWVRLSQQFSSRHRTSNKNNTEYRTSVQKLLCYNNNKENSEKKQTQKQFFTVTVRDKSRDNYWNPKFQTINST